MHAAQLDKRRPGPCQVPGTQMGQQEREFGLLQIGQEFIWVIIR
jgi:hypothetical protein